MRSVENERDPVSLNEYVLRRIHKNQFDRAQDNPVLRLAFKPAPPDTDGISVFRERFVSPTELANAGRKPGEYYVARLSVRELKDTLALSVIADPDENQQPGHALIPELNTSNALVPWSRELQRELAKLASRSIVHEPEPYL